MVRAVSYSEIQLKAVLLRVSVHRTFLAPASLTALYNKTVESNPPLAKTKILIISPRV